MNYFFCFVSYENLYYFKESNISNFPDEKLKGMIIKMLVKIRGRMDEQSENFNREEKIKVPNKSHRAEEYNN